MWRRLAFGSQGAETSKDCAFHVCTICNARIRMSYWVVIFFVYSLVQLLQREVHRPNVSGEFILWEVLRAIGGEALLLGTVLCHEFGHGNMARWLGGEIDHVLLWVFGGICFSSTPRTADNWKLLRNDLLVVGAGPFTHFLQVPVWGAVLLGLCCALPATGYAEVTDAFWAAVNPLHSFDVWTVRHKVGLWPSLPWALVGDALDLNVILFLFNVFVPMYPADGSKLLVLILMFCFGVTPRCAAIVLLVVSVPVALFFVSNALMAHLGNGGGPMLRSGIMLWMGVMSLCEAYRIWTLLSAKRLHEHPLFQTARSWRTEERDNLGRFSRVNRSNFDDDQPLSGSSVCCVRDLCVAVCGACDDDDEESSKRCRPCCCCPCGSGDSRCPCLWRGGKFGDESADLNQSRPGYGSATEGIRSDRGTFLSKLEQQNMERHRTVKDLTEERYAAAKPEKR